MRGEFGVAGNGGSRGARRGRQGCPGSSRPAAEGSAWGIEYARLAGPCGAQRSSWRCRSSRPALRAATPRAAARGAAFACGRRAPAWPTGARGSTGAVQTSPRRRPRRGSTRSTPRRSRLGRWYQGMGGESNPPPPGRAPRLMRAARPGPLCFVTRGSPKAALSARRRLARRCRRRRRGSRLCSRRRSAAHVRRRRDGRDRHARHTARDRQLLLAPLGPARGARGDAWTSPGATSPRSVAEGPSPGATGRGSRAERGCPRAPSTAACRA